MTAGHSEDLDRTACPAPGGVERLHDPLLNKGTAFTAAEREAFGLRGLLPPRVFTQEQQMARSLANVRRQPSPLERYVAMTALQDRNERVFYRILTEHLSEFLPIVYTPTVGEACQAFGRLFRRPRGLYVSLEDRGRVRELVSNWPHRNVRVIVVTDGERILGLGDLGAHGMGIPIGKLALYTACAGIDPAECLPVLVDVGTNNAQLREDPLYIGLPRERAGGDAYDDLIEEFVRVAEEEFPGVLIQFEDFATDNAVRLLRTYRDRSCAFNDDIQGTAAVTLAGLMTASRSAGVDLCEQRILFVGAGAAATGIADLCTLAMTRQGLDHATAQKRIWLFDSQGLVTGNRPTIESHKRSYAHAHPPIPDLVGAIEQLRPTALIGVSSRGGIFTAGVLRAMAHANERPIIFALSNPTANAECTAKAAYTHTGGRAIFASGSPFEPVPFAGRTIHTSQANNVYVFPGIGLGVIASGATRVTDDMFLAAAAALAAFADERMIRDGTLFPPLDDMREVALTIATSVASVAFDHCLTAQGRPADIRAHVSHMQFDPRY
jgi:malate dehydrogenase (oxaloacetate-decarboxylating)(NADP+)